MELLKRNKTNKGKVTKKPQRGTSKRTLRSSGKKKARRGGKREGAGRPSIYPGKDLSRHATAYFTPEGWKKLDEVRDALLKRYSEQVTAVTISDACEKGIHTLHRELTRPR